MGVYLEVSVDPYRVQKWSPRGLYFKSKLLLLISQFILILEQIIKLNPQLIHFPLNRGKVLTHPENQISPSVKSERKVMPTPEILI